MTTAATTTMLGAALEYISRGVPVFPCYGVVDGRCECGRADCGNQGKHPIGALVPHGVKDASTDPAVVQRWWTQVPSANIATPTSWCTVLDVDPRHGGDESLAELQSLHGAVPDTAEVLTGGGGRHVYFRPVPGLGPSAGKVGPGLDIRAGDGAYVMLPPSAHVSGGTYCDDLMFPLFDTEFVTMPTWMVARAMSANGPAPGAHTETAWAALLAGAPAGQRHDVAVRIAGHFLGKKLLAAEVEEILIGFAVRCTPPFDVEDCRRIVRDLAAKDQRGQAAAGPNTAASDQPRTVSWAEMVRGTRRPIEYHWQGWIPLAAVAMLVGAGETFKSWLALMVAIATASGRSLLATPGTDEDQPLRQGPVLYITGENAIEEEQRRCQLLQAALDLPDDLPITFMPAEALNLSQDEDYAEVVGLVTALHPVLIVVDSAIAVSGVSEEKDNNLVRVFMKHRVLPLARRHRATVLVLGHSPKPSQQAGMKFTDEHVARGAGDWRNASDVVLYLRREPSLGQAAVVLRHAKVRIGRRRKPLWFAVDDHAPDGVRLTLGGAYDDATAQASGALAKALQAALDVLRETAGIFAAELVTRLEGGGIAKATGRRAVEILRGNPKHPWPYGPLAGRVFAVVDEVKEGKRPRLILDPGRLDQVAPAAGEDSEAI